MAHTIYKNNSETLVVGNVSAVSVIITVADGTQLPVPAAGEIVYATMRKAVTLDNEVISYTSLVGNTVSGITRDIAGTGALPFVSNDLFQIRIPNTVLSEFIQRQGTEASGGNRIIGNLEWSAANAPAILNENASSINPVLIPDRTNFAGGVGSGLTPGDVSVIGAPADSVTSAGHIVNITAGIGGDTSGAAGIVNITGGDAGANSFASGGNVNVSGGDGSANGGPGFSDGGRVNIDGGDAVATDGGGGRIVLTGGTGTGSSDGGIIGITGGTGGATGDGGRVSVTGGQSGPDAASSGGDVNLVGGNASGNASGGDINIDASDGVGTGVAGIITITSGRPGSGDAGPAGPVNIIGGEGVNSTAQVGGAINIDGGNAGPTGGTGAGGAINITSGDGGGTSGDSGDILLNTGVVVSGTAGVFKFLRSGVPSVAGQVWTASAVDGTGYWAAAGAATSVSDADGDTLYQVEEFPDEDQHRWDTGDGGLAGYPAMANVMRLESGFFVLSFQQPDTDTVEGSSIQFSAGNALSNADGGQWSATSGSGANAGNGGLMAFTSGTGGATSGDGGIIDFSAGAGGGSGDGGNILIDSGAGGATGGAGDILITCGATIAGGVPGDLILTAGSNTGTDAGEAILRGGEDVGGGDTGGDARIQGGTGGQGGDARVLGGSSTAFLGGGVIITAGAGGGGAADGGPVDITGGQGNGTGDGGIVDIRGGSPGVTSGAGGAVLLRTVDVSVVTENSGAVTIESGNAGATSGNSGNLIIETGTAGGTTGTISLRPGAVVGVTYTEASSNVIQDSQLNAGITASTTQTQGNGVLLSSYNEVSTVANANDTVTLPAAVAGRKCVVINNGANILQVFPASGDNLGAGVNTSETIPSGESKDYLAFDSTNWDVPSTATVGADSVGQSQLVNAYARGWQFISSTVAAASATEVDITLSTDFDIFKIYAHGVTGTVNNEALGARFQTQGGGFRSGASDYSWGYTGTSVATTTASASLAGNEDDTDIVIGINVGTADDEEHSSFEMTILGANDSGEMTRLHAISAAMNPTPDWITRLSAGGVTTSEVNDAIRIFLPTGNISGTFVLMGINTGA